MPHRPQNNITLAAPSDLTSNTDSIVGERAPTLNATTSSIAQRCFRAQRASSTLHESASSAPTFIVLSVPAASSPSAPGADAAPATIAALTDSSLRSSSESSATRSPLGGRLSGLGDGLGQRLHGRRLVSHCHSRS